MTLMVYSGAWGKLIHEKNRSQKSRDTVPLKVHKIENFFGFDFELYTVSLLVMLKYEGFVTKNF